MYGTNIFFAKMTQDAFALLVLAGVVSVIMAILGICQVFVLRRQKKQRLEQLALIDAEYKRWRREVTRTRKLSPVHTSVCLDDGERCYFQAYTMLSEPRAVRHTTHLGGAVHVAKGVTLGGGNSTSESHDEWRDLSQGMFCITNKRIIFDGDMHNRTVKLSALISVWAEPNRIAISTATRQKTMLFSNLNGQIARGIINILRNSSS